jgi:hypothetical protein
MGLEALLVRLEARPVTSVTSVQTGHVTEKALQNKDVTPVTPVTPETIGTEARRGRRARKVLALLARDGCQYAVLVEDSNTDPIIMTVATRGGTREVLIPRDKYDPFEVLARVHTWSSARAQEAKP